MKLTRRPARLETPGEKGWTTESEQDALFDIEQDEEDGCVWICSAEGRDDWCQNLGPVGPVAARLHDFLFELQKKRGKAS